MPVVVNNNLLVGVSGKVGNNNLTETGNQMSESGQVLLYRQSGVDPALARRAAIGNISSD